jgi:LPS O-antigen subunit length determinant protein (WzzB/FepE family)
VPNYQANVSISSVSSGSLTSINKLIYTDETKYSIFSDFLSNVLSQDLQKNVFLENDFLTKFNKNNSPIDDVDNFIEAIINSVKVIVPKLKKSDMEIYLDEKPYSVSFTGSDKKAISSYLDILIEQADKENIMELVRLNKQKTRMRLNEISVQIETITNQAKKNRLNQIVALTEAAKLAKSLGIVENNLNIFKDINAVNIAIGDSNNLPDWYLYGEKALLERIEILANRPSDDPYIPELVYLNIEKDRLESLDHNLLGTSSINLISSSKIKNISRSKRLIVSIAFIAGFMMSILLVLIMSAFKPNEKELLPK